MPKTSHQGAAPRDPVTISGGTDPQLDAVCRTAAALFGTRYAFVSQLNAEYQWYIGSSSAIIGKMPRAETFCTNMREDGSHETLVVLDALRDDRFSNLPFVRLAPHIRFYAGIPLALRGMTDTVTMCVADNVARQRFGATEERRLLDLALFVEAILDVRLGSQRAAEAGTPVRRPRRRSNTPG
jgi:GAF domain-containing protein